MNPRIEPMRCHIAGQAYLVRELAEADRAQVCRLFATAFGQQPHPQWHAWKYAHGQAVGLFDTEGQLLAHYAGFPRQLLWHGTPMAAIQIGDVMVDPRVRGLLTRKGPFYQVCQAFFGSQVGNGKPYALAFGFSNDRAVRLGKALDLYHNPEAIRQLRWPLGGSSWPWGWQARRLVSSKAIKQLAERLWPAMQRPFAGEVIGVRNPAYLEQRYLQRPDQGYLFLAIKPYPWCRAGGLVILAHRGDDLEWLDYLGSKNLMPQAIEAIKRWGARHGKASLTAWASPRLAAELAATTPSDLGIAAYLAVAKASRVPAETILTAPWCWMGGDTDFL